MHRSSVVEAPGFYGELDQIDPKATAESLKNEQIKRYLHGMVQQEDAPHDPRSIREATEGLNLSGNITDPVAAITTYFVDVFKRLDAIRYSKFKSENPKYIIRLLLERLNPPALKSAMEDRVKVESDLEENIRTFIQRLKNDAALFQAFGQRLGSSERPVDGSETVGLQDIRKYGNEGINKLSLRSESKKAQSAGKLLWICLYPPQCKHEGVTTLVTAKLAHKLKR